MIAELLSLADMLSKVKDLKSLLMQERLETIIGFLETVGEVQIRTAIRELRAVHHSTRPDAERDRAIGHLNIAATALTLSLEKRPLLKRLAGLGKPRQMRTYLQATGCYLVIAIIYQSQRNTQLAQLNAVAAARAFEGYAEIRRQKVLTALIFRFSHTMSAVDQSPLVDVVDNKEIRDLMRRYNLSGLPNESTLHKLAAGIVNEEREQLFGPLRPLGLG